MAATKDEEAEEDSGFMTRGRGGGGGENIGWRQPQDCFEEGGEEGKFFLIKCRNDLKRHAYILII